VVAEKLVGQRLFPLLQPEPFWSCPLALGASVAAMMALAVALRVALGGMRGVALGIVRGMPLGLVRGVPLSGMRLMVRCPRRRFFWRRRIGRRSLRPGC